MLRKVDKILYHPNFESAFQSLSRVIQEKAVAREMLFRDNIFHPLLKTHKLKGRLAGLYSFSIDFKYRILFKFYKESIIFLDIDDHDLYK